jgi:DNA-binding NarL/FixJ family response regulator
MILPDLPFLIGFGPEALSEEGSDPSRSKKLDSQADFEKSSLDRVKILVVEDHQIARKAIRDLLRREKDFEVVWEAENGLEGAEAAQRLQPDIILLDVTMPTLGGIEAAVRIRRVAKNARIVFLSQHNSDKLAQAALATGAHAYVVKSAAGNDLVRAIRAVIAGKKFTSKLASWGDH